MQKSKEDPLYNYYVLVDGESMTVSIQKNRRPDSTLRYYTNALNTTLNASYSINSGLYNLYQGNYKNSAVDTLKGVGDFFEILTLGAGSYLGDHYKKISAGSIVHGTPEDIVKMQDTYKSSVKGMVDFVVASYTSKLLPSGSGNKMNFQPEYAYATSSVGVLSGVNSPVSSIVSEVAGGMRTGAMYAVAGKGILENTDKDNTKNGEISSKASETKNAGRKGNEETRLQNESIAELGKELDWKHVSGGNQPEEYMKAINKTKGTSKGGNYIDITLKKNIKGQDVTVRINTVDVYKRTGAMKPREIIAADSINLKIESLGNDPKLITIPKGQGTANLEEILRGIERAYSK